MKLLVEAGSTKSDWVLFFKGNEDKYSFDGINPTTNPGSENLIKKLNLPFEEVTEVYYYGAGTARKYASNRIVDIFSKICSNLQIVKVMTDMQAACKVCYKDSDCIVSILGTGSNTVLYNGQNISHQVPSLGYLFGDLGSGFAIGRAILERYFHNLLSKSDRLRFEYTYEEDLEDMLGLIYNASRPNYKLAQYTKFLDVASDELKYEILRKCFGDFVKNSIGKIENSLDYKLNFVGSIAAHFNKPLRTICESHGYTVDIILKSPLEKLIEIHRSN